MIDEYKQKMANYCAYQDRCQWEVEQKLHEFHLTPLEREAIIIYLIQDNYLNEERFTRSYVRGKFYQKKWGKVKIGVELKKRKIPVKMIQQAFSEIDADDYTKTIAYLAEKKIATLSGTTISKHQKVTAYLYQKGYEYDLIKDWLNELSN